MGAKMSIEEKLWTAGRRGDVAAIRKIGAMPRSAEEQFNLFSWHHPKEGTTALMEAVIAFSNGAAEALLLLGSPVNARHPLTGATPMHFAVGRRGAGTAAAAILLNAGGDVTVRNNRGRTPLDQAREAGHLVMVRYLEQSLAAFAAPVKLYQDGSFASSLGSLFGANIARKATSALGGKWQDAWLVVLNVPTARACGSGIAEVCLYNSVNDVMYKQVMLMQGSAAQVEDAGKRILKLVPRNENAATAASAAAPTAAQWRIQLDGDEPFQRLLLTLRNSAVRLDEQGTFEATVAAVAHSTSNPHSTAAAAFATPEAAAAAAAASRAHGEEKAEEDAQVAAVLAASSKDAQLHAQLHAHTEEEKYNGDLALALAMSSGRWQDGKPYQGGGYGGSGGGGGYGGDGGSGGGSGAIPYAHIADNGSKRVDYAEKCDDASPGANSAPSAPPLPNDFNAPNAPNVPNAPQRRALPATPQQVPGQGMAEGKVGAADEGKVGAAGGDGKCGETDEGLDAEDNSCVVCMDAARTAVCVPCGHNAGCIECLTAIHESNQGCPVCRAELTQVIRLFTV